MIDHADTLTNYTLQTRRSSPVLRRNVLVTAFAVIIPAFVQPASNWNALTHTIIRRPLRPSVRRLRRCPMVPFHILKVIRQPGWWKQRDSRHNICAVSQSALSAVITDWATAQNYLRERDEVQQNKTLFISATAADANVAAHPVTSSVS